MTVSFAGFLTVPCEITRSSHSRGWFELPNGRTCQPKPSQVRFIPGVDKPAINTGPRRWWARLMGLWG